MNERLDHIVFSNEMSSVLNDRIDLFIACIGYEERSSYIYCKLKSMLNTESLLLLAIDDYESYPHAKAIIEEAKLQSASSVCIVKYNATELVQNIIVNRVKEKINNRKNAMIHIDYSSMPRGWYCKLPELLCSVLSNNCRVFFWYTEGEYASFDNEYPTAGINSYVLYSGKPSLIDRKCTHFIGVGYDSIRTNGIISLLNPESVITCAANNPDRQDVLQRVENVNKEIMNESYMNLSLDITDIRFMIAKLKGIVNEIFTIAQSDVILIPDGPKPLIFVMSMIPWMIEETGICCLHIVRNDNIFMPQNITARGKDTSEPFTEEDHIIGFSVSCLQD